MVMNRQVFSQDLVDLQLYAYTAISTTGAPSQLIALIDLISDDQSQQAAGYRRLPPPRVL
jgi:hypothetical protein